jgi:hypothetical protein
LLRAGFEAAGFGCAVRKMGKVSVRVEVSTPMMVERIIGFFLSRRRLGNAECTIENQPLSQSRLRM